MRSEPPKSLERVVGLLLPPACREEVLGDLYEKCETPRQYAATAARVVPSVILSRIRRTSDAQTLMMAAALVYASFLGAVWFTDKSLLNDQRTFGQIAIPAFVALAFLIFDDAWTADRSGSPVRLLRGGALGLGAGSIFVVVSMPLQAVLLGCAASLLMISGVRLLLPVETTKLQSTAGPVVANGHPAMNALVIGVVVFVVVLVLELLGLKSPMVIIAVFLVLAVSRTWNRKE
jgi:hypothetical protein